MHSNWTQTTRQTSQRQGKKEKRKDTRKIGILTQRIPL